MIHFSKKGFILFGTITGIAFVIGLISVIGLQVFLNTETARQMILQEINKTLPVTLSAGTHRLRLFSGRLDLADVLIEGSDNKPILSMAHFHADTTLLPLLRGVLDFDALSIENPAFYFRADHAETLRLINELSGPDEETTEVSSDDFPVNIKVTEMTITGGRFHYAQADPEVTCDIEKIRLTLKNGNLLKESGSVTLRTGKIAVNGPDLTAVFNESTLKGTLDDGQLKPVALGVRAENFMLDISGRVSDLFTSPGIVLSADLTSRPDAAGFKTGFAGTLISHLELEGGGASAETFALEGRLEITSPDLSLEDVFDPLKATLRADAGYRNQMIRLGRLDINAGGVHLSAAGHYDMATDNIDSSLALNVPDLADSIPAQGFGPFGGLMTLTAGISGKLKNPSVEARLQGKALTIQGRKAGDVDAVFELEDGRLIVEKFGLTQGKSKMSASGTIDIIDSETGEIQPDPALAVTLAESSIYLADFFETIKGDLSLGGRVEGRISNPQGVFSLSGENIETGVQRFEDIALAVSFNRNNINLDRCVVTLVPGQQIKATGKVRPMDNDYDFHLYSDDISVSAVDSLRNLTGTSANLKLDIGGRGSLEKPRLEGSLNITDLTVRGKKRDDLQIDLGLDKTDVSLTGDIGFNINALYNVDTLDFKAKAEFDKTNLMPFFELLEQGSLGGLVTGTIQAEGKIDSPETVIATADIRECTIDHNGRELIQTDAFQALVENMVLTIPGIHLNFPEKGALDFSGRGVFGGDIDFSATGIIPAEVIRLYTDDYTEITGVIRLAGSVKGTFTAPQIESRINLVNLGARVPELMQRLHDVNGQITLTPQNVSVDMIRGKLGDGEFRLSADLTLKDGSPVYLEAKLSTTALPVRIPDTIDMLVNTELSVRGGPDDSLLEGSVVILEGLYYRDVSLSLLNTIGRKTRYYTPAGKEVDLPFLHDPKLKIFLKSRRPLYIDNNIAVMTLHPDLSFYGTINKPLVRGRASVPSGIIIYQDKDFQITKGVVDFINPYKIEPAVDITGQVAVREWMIYLTVSGKPDNLKFELSSDPAEEHWNILSLLTFGKTVEELNGNISDGNTASSKQRIADMLARSLEGKLSSETSFDSIEMKYSEGVEKDDSDDIKVTVGKKLAERLTLKYGVETKNGVTVQSAGSEYLLLERLLMKAFHDTEGDFGGELVYRLEFR